MTKYKVTLDGEVIDEGLIYSEARELAAELDEHPRNFWKTVDIEPMEEE